VDRVTFSVKEGEIFGFLGPNGAGKTTTINMLTTVLKPTSGRAEVCGYDVVREPERVRRSIGVVPQEYTADEDLTGYENVMLCADLYGLPREEGKKRALELLSLVQLEPFKDKRVETYSGGMRRRLELACGLINRPRVLFLDEPTASLSPEAAGVVRDFILELKREGRTIFLCTHNLYEAERLCDRVAILSTRLLALGSPGELKRRFGSPRTEVHLERVTEELVEAVRGLGFVRGVEVEGEKLVVELEDPETQNPSLVEALVRRGGRVRYVTPSPHALEETYLRLVRGSEA
jgi:ABC-2 type transport system ATP-binding protein